MGIDSNRFEGAVDEELICPICSSVLEDPVQVRPPEGILETSVKGSVCILASVCCKICSFRLGNCMKLMCP